MTAGPDRSGPETGAAVAARMRAIYALAVLGIALVLVLKLFAPSDERLGVEMLDASRTMDRAVRMIVRCREARGIPIDRETDLNGTGLIGLASSPITTSLGDLEAKRTSANPDMAGLVARLLDEAGVRRGDAVAVGASGSFPALVIASIAGTLAVGAEPLVISSVGASEWGANDPRFPWTAMEACLRSGGLWDVRSIARSIGGEEDRGRNMTPEGRALAEKAVRADGVPVIEAAGQAEDVAARLRAYDAAAAAARRRIAAFVNVGGNSANIGTDPSVLKLAPGLTRAREVPAAAPQSRGVIQVMAERGIPVVHLLHVRGLVRRYGLPWDPVPLPKPGAIPAQPARRPGLLPLAAVVLYLGAVATVLFLSGERRGGIRRGGSRERL